MSSIARYLILVLVGILTGLLYGWSQYHKGYADHETFAKVQTAIQNEVARAREQALQNQINDLDAKHYQEYQNAQKTITQLRADVAAGNRRLSVRVRQLVCTAKDTKTASLDNGTARADIDEQDAQDLIGIVIQGDQAIRQLNALQDWAEIVTK